MEERLFRLLLSTSSSFVAFLLFSPPPLRLDFVNILGFFAWLLIGVGDLRPEGDRDLDASFEVLKVILLFDSFLVTFGIRLSLS